MKNIYKDTWNIILPACGNGGWILRCGSGPSNSTSGAGLGSDKPSLKSKMYNYYNTFDDVALSYKL